MFVSSLLATTVNAFSYLLWKEDSSFELVVRGSTRSDFHGDAGDEAARSADPACSLPALWGCASAGRPVRRRAFSLLRALGEGVPDVRAGAAAVKLRSNSNDVKQNNTSRLPYILCSENDILSTKHLE